MHENKIIFFCDHIGFDIFKKLILKLKFSKKKILFVFNSNRFKKKKIFLKTIANLTLFFKEKKIFQKL